MIHEFVLYFGNFTGRCSYISYLSNIFFFDEVPNKYPRPIPNTRTKVASLRKMHALYLGPFLLFSEKFVRGMNKVAAVFQKERPK